MYELALKFWSETLTSDGERAALISMAIFGVIALVTLIIKWRRLGMERADTFSQIDERRFNQLSTQLETLRKEMQDMSLITETLTLERDHYRSKVRDLVFSIRQLEWEFQKREDLDWPLKYTPDEIEKRALSSPVEVQQEKPDEV